MNYVSPESCSDCGGSFELVELTDYTTGDRVRHYGYSMLFSKDRPTHGNFPAKGELKFFMCVDCGRVLLKAQQG